MEQGLSRFPQWPSLKYNQEPQRISPIQAALLNSTFIQGFELDDWHSEAPLHSNSIILPALFAAAEHLNKNDSQQKVHGADFLLAMIVGHEVGPRVGNGLHGGDMITRGWHSGALFGLAASSTVVAKLMHLPASLVEDALGIACTQACGLMSQYESEVKRMQHGFAARNGLLGAFLARGGYVGIKQFSNDHMEASWPLLARVATRILTISRTKSAKVSAPNGKRSMSPSSPMLPWQVHTALLIASAFSNRTIPTHCKTSHHINRPRNG